MGRLILVTGGARSGKSTFAEQLAAKLGGNEVLYIATAEALDDDMRQRIAAHRQARPAAWQTEEAPRDVGHRLCEVLGSRSVVLVDCLTLLVSNAVLSLGDEPDAREAERRALNEVDQLVEAALSSTATVILVTNEVGLGLVPPYKLGRIYRDVLGKVNQRVAAQAEAVYLLVSGLPIDVKQLAFRWP
jgi:adenosylcobinamide kinase/adenosylcobinamide-phosphate guanylyltransferase